MRALRPMPIYDSNTLVMAGHVPAIHDFTHSQLDKSGLSIYRKQLLAGESDASFSASLRDWG